MAIRLLSRQNLRKLAASFTLLNSSQKILLSPPPPARRSDAISPSKCLSPFYPFVYSRGVRWASYESVNLVLSDDGKPKFEIEEVEPSKKGRFLTKRRLKLQRKREKRKRKEANKNDPRRIRPKGKKIKQKFPTAEARLKYKIEKSKLKEAMLVEKLKRYEVAKAEGPVAKPDDLNGEERFYLKKVSQKKSNYVPIGRRGVFGGVILNMHLHWKKHETVKVICKPCKPGQIQEYANEIARLSGGVPINVIGNDTIVFYRGKDYVQPEVMSPIDTLSKKKVRRTNPSSILKDHNGAEVEELILKCGGLPKVIVAIAGVLAKQTVKWMDTVLSLNQTFIHQLETKLEYDSLRDLFGWMHSYFRTCPDSLKPCIFYLSIFPQDQIIRRRRLVRRWIAEGYSRDGNEESAEEDGEKQFSELLDLSIIKEVPQLITAAEFNDKKMALCQVNGFVRDYIIPLRKEENLVFELRGSCALTTQRTGRHLIILEDWDRDKTVFESIDFSRLRSLTVFGKWESFFISESMKLLRVLDLEDASRVEYEDLKKMVKWLRRLKFLSLRGRHEICRLPSSLHHLRQLQTLDVRGTSIITLPRSITKLQKLQYIRAGIIAPVASAPSTPSSWFCRCRRIVGVVVPRGIGELAALHTLGVINVSASGGQAILEELKKLTQLRKLGVSGINRHNNKKFFSTIEDHGHLESLSVWLDKGHEGCLGAMISLPCKNLESLKLYGLDNKLPLVGNDQLSKLRKLDLEMATLNEEGIAFLAMVPKLSILQLRVKQPSLHFIAELYGNQLATYKNVKILEISCNSRNLHVIFGSRSLKSLELLKLDCSSGSLDRLSGLDHLSELKEVFLMGTNDGALKEDLEKQLLNHPKKPAVKLA